MADQSDPEGPPADFRELRPDTRAEHAAVTALNDLVPGYDEKMAGILGDMDREAAADKAMLEGEEELMANRAAPEVAGVDISAIKAADPAFDDQAFLTIARESYQRVREAQSRDNLQFTDAELSPQLLDEFKRVVAGDVQSHRHHLLPGLEITSAAIESATVADTRLTIVVRFHLEAEEVDVDESAAVVAGDYTQRQWDENWTFERDTSVDAAPVDNALTFVPIEAGGWLVAHRGWTVTAVERLGAADPLDPNDL